MKNRFFYGFLRFAATFMVAAMVFAGCDQPTDDDKGPAKVATPVADIQPAEGEISVTVAPNTPVTLSCETEGASIYYTLDETDPTAESTEYTEGVTITGEVGSTRTLKAIGVKEGLTDSDILTVAYMVSDSVVATPTANPSGGAVSAGTQVTLSTTTTGADIYYTLDGSNPDNTKTKYEAPITVTEALTIKAIAIKDGTGSDVLTAVYTVAAPAYTLAFLEVSQGFTAPVSSGVTEYRVKGIPYGKDTVTITAVSAAGAAKAETVTLTDAEQTVELDGGYTVKVPAKLTAAPVPTEGDDVTINVTIAVRVIAPKGVMTYTDTELTYGNANGAGNDRINGVRAHNTTQNNGANSSWSAFYTANFSAYDTYGRGFNYDAASGLWIHNGGGGKITRNMKIRANTFTIYDDYKGTGKDGGFSYSRTNDREVLIDEEGDVYLFYTVTLKKTITISGTVTLSGSLSDYSTSAVSNPYFYTVAPGSNGKGISANRVAGYMQGTPAAGPYDGSFLVRIEAFDASTQLWFIPGTVRVSTSGTSFRDSHFEFDPIMVHDSDITNLSFSTTPE
jgi:hypothetical protein